MLTNEIRNQIDQIWKVVLVRRDFQSARSDRANHLFAFIKRLDELQRIEELKADRLQPMSGAFSPTGRTADIWNVKEGKQNA